MSIRHTVGALLLAAALPAASLAVEPNLELEFVYSSAGGDPLHDAAIDRDGNIVMSGARGNSSGATSNSYFVAKYDSYGREIWNRSYSTGSGSYFSPSSAIATGRDGDVYMVTSESYAFGRIVHYDVDGNETVLTPGESVPEAWEHRIGLRVDHDGNLYLRAANSVRKYDPDGTQLWNKRIFSHWASWVRDIQLDAAGNVYAVGRAYGASTNTADLYVTKFDPAGNVVWSQRHFHGAFSEAFAARLDSAGNLVVLGQGQNALGDMDTLLLTYDVNGNLSVLTQQDFGGNERPIDFELDELDNAYVLISHGNYLTAKFDPAGVLLWSARAGTERDNRPGGIALDPLGNVAVSGSTGYNHYSQRLLTVSYDTNGNELWQRTDTGRNLLGGWVEFGRTGEVYAGAYSVASAAGDAYMLRYRLCPCTSCQ